MLNVQQLIMKPEECDCVMFPDSYTLNNAGVSSSH